MPLVKRSAFKTSLGIGFPGQIIEAIAFNAADKYTFDPLQNQVRLVYELDKNTFNGTTSLQLRILYLEQWNDHKKTAHVSGFFIHFLLCVRNGKYR